MAKYIELPDGTLINPDSIKMISPTLGNGMYNVAFTDKTVLKLTPKEYDSVRAQLPKDDNQCRELSSVINRLIPALDRLSARIPPSIRMHM